MVSGYWLGIFSRSISSFDYHLLLVQPLADYRIHFFTDSTIQLLRG